MTAMVGLLARLHALGSAVPVVVGLFVMLPCTSHAQEPAYTLAIRDHRFEPSEIDIPAGKKVALVVRNLDPTPEQFDSTQLRQEKRLTTSWAVKVRIWHRRDSLVSRRIVGLLG